MWQTVRKYVYMYECGHVCLNTSACIFPSLHWALSSSLLVLFRRNELRLLMVEQFHDQGIFPTSIYKILFFGLSKNIYYHVVILSVIVNGF